MNVFFYGYNLRNNAGGIERYTSTILRELKKRGHKVFVYVLSEGNEDPEFTYLNKEVKPIRYVDRFIRSYRIKAYLAKRNIKIDLFLCGHIHLIAPCEDIARRLAVSYDLFVYGIDCWGTLFKDAMPGMKHLRKVISISSFTTEQVRKQGYQGEVVYFPPLIDVPNDIGPSPVSHSDKVVLLTVSRLDAAEQYKGQDTVIKALGIVHGKRPNVEYWIVGRGNDTDRLKALTTSLNLDESVKFFGFVSDEELRRMNERADICILPSKVSLDPARLQGEGFGIVFIEAAVFSKALIGPNIGGSTDIIQNEVNGLTCDPQDVEEVAQCIIRLADDEPLRRRLGNAAHQSLIEKFSLLQFDLYMKPLLPIQ